MILSPSGEDRTFQGKPRASGDDPDDKFKAFNWLT